MSYVRIWSSATAYTDYTDVWDVEIEPESISGARFHSQEPRTATFKMYSSTINELFNTVYVADGLFPYIVEIWETFTYADQNNTLQPQEKVLFRGYVFRNGIMLKQ